jgi:cold shock CspA family protein
MYAAAVHVDSAPKMAATHSRPGQHLKVTVMPIGKINKLVHLSQQTYQPNSKLIPGHNDKGYGTIDADTGREVYFSHDAVPGSRGFDDLYRGQTVEYSLENGEHPRANSVKPTPTIPLEPQSPTLYTTEGRP